MPIPRDEFFRTLAAHRGPANRAVEPAVREAERLALEVLRRAPGDFYGFAEVLDGIASMPGAGTGMDARLAIYLGLERALAGLVAEGEVEAYPRGGAMYFAART